MKRFLSIIMVLVLAVSAAGCGTRTEDSITSPDLSEPSGIEDSRQIIHVETVEELVCAAASETSIQLAPGVYDLTQWVREDYKGELSEKVTLNWDHSIQIRDAENLRIEAENPDDPPKIVVDNERIPVLTFINCENLELAGLTLGHDVAPGSCTGSVIRLEQCRDSTLTRMNLYGCGAYGLEICGGSGIKVSDTLIHDCTEGGIQMDAETNVDFYDTSFVSCGEYNILDCQGNGNLSFYRCSFEKNQGPLIPAAGEYEKDCHYRFIDCSFGNQEKQYLDSELAVVEKTQK